MPGHVPPAGGRQPPRCGTSRRLLLAQSRAWVKRQRPHASLCGDAGKPPAASRHPAAGLRRTMRCLGGYHFAFDTGPRFSLCYASLPLDTCRACLHTVRTLLAGKRCVWCQAQRSWLRQGRDGLRRSPRGRSGSGRAALSRRACHGWRDLRHEKRDETAARLKPAMGRASCHCLVMSEAHHTIKRDKLRYSRQDQHRSPWQQPCRRDGKTFFVHAAGGWPVERGSLLLRKHSTAPEHMG